MPHVNKNPNSKKANFCSNTIFSLYFQIRVNKFHAVKRRNEVNYRPVQILNVKLNISIIYIFQKLKFVAWIKISFFISLPKTLFLPALMKHLDFIQLWIESNHNCFDKTNHAKLKKNVTNKRNKGRHAHKFFVAGL